LQPELAQFCSPAEFAVILRISVKTVYAWLSEGRLDSVSQRFGKHRRILTVPALELLFSKPNWSK
jgi:excisionase family DNA binding protein